MSAPWRWPKKPRPSTLSWTAGHCCCTPGTGGGFDAGFANQSGKAAVLESLGLPGWGYRAKNEYVEIDSIVPRLYLSARLLIDLARD